MPEIDFPVVQVSHQLFVLLLIYSLTVVSVSFTTYVSSNSSLRLPFVCLSHYIYVVCLSLTTVCLSVSLHTCRLSHLPDCCLSVYITTYMLSICLSVCYQFVCSSTSPLSSCIFSVPLHCPFTFFTVTSNGCLINAKLVCFTTSVLPSIFTFHYLSALLPVH